MNKASTSLCRDGAPKLGNHKMIASHHRLTYKWTRSLQFSKTSSPHPYKFLKVMKTPE